jgi:hypothetical protein
MSIRRWFCRNRCFPNEFRRNLTRDPVAKSDSGQRPSNGPDFCDRPCFRKFSAGNVRLLAASFVLHLSILDPA